MFGARAARVPVLMSLRVTCAPFMPSLVAGCAPLMASLVAGLTPLVAPLPAVFTASVPPVRACWLRLGLLAAPGRRLAALSLRLAALWGGLSLGVRYIEHTRSCEPQRGAKSQQ